MYFYEKIKEMCKDKETVMYVDMDGVIAAYDFGNPLDFAKKRPLLTNIKKLEEISKLENIELKILSACKKNFQIDEKNVWLDKYAPFFKQENRIILSREKYDNELSCNLKAQYLNSIDEDRQVILLDDDNNILKVVSKSVDNVICIQDSEMID